VTLAVTAYIVAEMSPSIAPHLDHAAARRNSKKAEVDQYLMRMAIGLVDAGFGCGAGICWKFGDIPCARSLKRRLSFA
jgi:hypothetical protein